MMNCSIKRHPLIRGFPYTHFLFPAILTCLISFRLVAQELTIYTSGFGDSAEEVRQQAIFYAGKLGIAPDSKMILMIAAARELPAGMSGLIDYELNEIIGIHNVIIKISAELRGKNLGQTLAHEMTHLAQYTEGKLKRIDGTLLRWQGQLIFDANKIPYMLRSWEIEAFQKEKDLFRAYEKACWR